MKSIMKKGSMVLSLLVIALLFVLSFSPKSAAAGDATWIMANAGEDCSTQMNFIWESASTSSTIEIAKLNDTTYTHAIVKQGAKIADAYLGTGRFVYRIDISGLTPDTEYRYRVFTTAYSEEQYFETAPANNESAAFNFIFHGDNHCYAGSTSRASLTEKMIKSAEAKTADSGGIDFSLNIGDFLAYGTSVGSWEQFHSIGATKRMMWAMCPGNHEYYNTSAKTINGEDYFNRGTNYPSNGSKGDIGNTYYFTYGEALFVAIDSESIANYNHLAPMREWFCDVVEHNPHRWLIVYQHRPFYTGNGLNAGQSATSRSNWMDLFDKYGVDLVLTGHNHVYARSYQIYNDEPVTGNGKGTTYMTCSQIGDRYVTDPGTKMANVAFTLVGKIDSGTIISVTHDAINLTSIKNDGTVFDTDTIYPKTETITDLNSFKESIEVAANSTFTLATLSYDDTGLGSDPIIATSLSTVYGEGKKEAALSKNAKSVDVNYKITLRTGEVYEGSVTLSNPYKNFGSITDLAITLGDTERAATLTFTNALTGPAPTGIEVYADDVLIASADKTATEVALSDFDIFATHFVEVKIVSSDNVLAKSYLEYESPVTSLAINEPALSLEEGGSKEIIVSGASGYERFLSFTSSDEAVASVDEHGKINARGSGEAIITASVGTAKAEVKVTVTSKEALAIEVEEATLKKGATTTLHINKPGVTYTTSDELVARVDENGVVTAIGKGKATITATRGSEVATVTIKVTSGGCSGAGAMFAPLLAFVVIGAFAFRRHREEKDQ